EGVLLRYLSRVHKVLTQTVPDAAKNDTVREMELYLGTMIRQIDSSLLDEWEKMRDPNYQRAETKEVRPPGAEEADQDITRDAKAFTAAIRNRIFAFLRGLVIGDFESVLAQLAEASPVGAEVTRREVPSPVGAEVTRRTDTPQRVPTDSEGQPWTADRLKQ